MLETGTISMLLVISAPSGAGKTTVCRNLMAADRRWSRVVTCTTRGPREGEVDGVDYHFLSGEAFAAREEADDFLEHAVVYGRRYGTLRGEVVGRLGEGHDVLLNIDVQGAAQVRDRAASDEALRGRLVTVFLVPPSLEELERRLRGRGTDAAEVVERRLGQARAEMGAWRDFDYAVVSGTMEEDLRRVRVIVEAERLRTARARSRA